VAGDASGHGMAAGLLMAIANATLKTAMDFDASPEAVLDLLNRVLVKTGDRRAFSRQDGRIEELGTGAFPLGIRDRVDWETREIVVHHGDLLVLYSDGLAEAFHPSAVEAYGYDRVRAQVAPGGTPQQVHDRILRDLEGFQHGEALVDDVSVVVVGRESGD